MHRLLTFQDQVAADKARLEAQVAKLPAGRQKDELLKNCPAPWRACAGQKQPCVIV
jgi:hypothetical protein